MLTRPLIFTSLGVVALGTVLYFSIPFIVGSSYQATTSVAVKHASVTTVEEEPEVILHKETPATVKAVYMSSWVAGTPSIRKKIVDLIERTEINAVVIDIKDATGRISFTTDNEYLNTVGAPVSRIADIKAFLRSLHEKDIYVIGRVAVFQDPYLVTVWPEETVRRLSDGGIWKDRKGISWMDPGSRKVWNYAVDIAKVSYDIGFDEINFDYVRFPTDGNMKDITYMKSEGLDKASVIESFFQHLHQALSEHPVVTSVDLFGMTTSNTDDLNIGQVLERALPYFDFISPMVYPSHYPNNWNGYANPAKVPYQVIHKAMSDGVTRAVALGEDPQKFRPWLQDFNLGATYTPELVRAQIQATYDVGLTSWMLWDPANTYTEAALVQE